MKWYISLVFVSAALGNENVIDLSKYIIEDYKSVDFNHYSLSIILKDIVPVFSNKTCWHLLDIFDSFYTHHKTAVDLNAKLCIGQAQINSSKRVIISSFRQVDAKMWAKEVLYEGHKEIVNTISDKIRTQCLNTGLIPFATAFFVLNRMSKDTQQIFFDHVYKNEWPFLVNKNMRFFSHYYSVYIGMVGGLLKKNLNAGKNYSLGQIMALNNFISRLKLDSQHEAKQAFDLLEKDFVDVIITALQDIPKK
jgi:hypothetical protein